MRVVPLENEAVNECWIADRDRFSYEGSNADDRLTAPMIKRRGGQWQTVTWRTRRSTAARAAQDRRRAWRRSRRALRRHRTVEELHLLARARARAWAAAASTTACAMPTSRTAPPGTSARWLACRSPRFVEPAGRPRRRLVPRKDHPLFAQPPPGGAQGRQGVRDPCAGGRLADPRRRADHRRAERLGRQALCRRLRRGGAGARRRRRRPATDRRGAGDCRRADERRAQGDPARQCRGPASAGGGAAALADWIASRRGAFYSARLDGAANSVGA